jgi:hypothetical protein
MSTNTSLRLTASQRNQLCLMVKRYKNKVNPRKQWNEWSNDDLWRKVLVQIVVVGGARAATLEKSVVTNQRISWERLRRLGNADLEKELHVVMRAVGTRYVGNWNTRKRTNNKVKCAARNLRILEAFGGPSKFFSKVAKLRTEEARIGFLREHLKYYGEKSARDTLIELCLAHNCLALDSRIIQLLKDVGLSLKLGNAKQYRVIETELIEKVARPCQIDGARLDRILFQNYDLIRADIALTPIAAK